MKIVSDRLVTSLLGGVAITTIGVCLVCIPALMQWPVSSHFGMFLSVVGGVLCFLLLELLGGHPPMALCFALAIAVWSSIIFGLRVLIGRARRHHDTKA